MLQTNGNLMQKLFQKSFYYKVKNKHILLKEITFVKDIGLHDLEEKHVLYLVLYKWLI